MQATLFIADLHLSDDRPDITAAFDGFMSNQARNAAALYVLGDLFEAWIGDDDTSTFNRHIKQSFRHLTDSGVPVYFIHGNRDFLIGRRFALETGIQLLPEQQVIDLYGEKVLIMHGDSLCTRDHKYMAFRRKSRGWWWPKLMLALPLWYRRRVAHNARKSSALHQKNSSEQIMDVTPSEVDRVMTETGVSKLIHGHTHRPAVHKFKLGDKQAQRIVLGDWYSQSSVLIVTPQSTELTGTPL